MRIKKFLLVAILISNSTLSFAQSAEDKARYQSNEKVYRLAEKVCPAAYEADSVATITKEIAKSQRLKTSEHILLNNFCLMYGLGLKHDIHEANENNND